MASIQVDDKIVERLKSQAAASGLTLETYVQDLLAKHQVLENTPMTLEEFDAELAALSIDGPGLPPDFSRADIYLDHD